MKEMTIEQFCFAWVEEHTQYDQSLHCLKDISVLHINLDHKRDQLFAVVKLLITDPSKIQMDKFLLISVNNVLFVKCKPICVSKNKIAGKTGYILELHAKSSDFQNNLDKMRDQNTFPDMFVRNKNDYHLVDHFLNTNRLTLQIEKISSSEEVMQEKIINNYFPHTLLQYQKAFGINELEIKLLLKWRYKIIKNFNLDKAQEFSVKNIDYKQLHNIQKKLPKIGQTYNKTKVIESELLESIFGFDNENGEYKPSLRFKVGLSLLSEYDFIVQEEVNIHFNAGLSKDCKYEKQKVNFYLNLEPLLENIFIWRPNISYNKKEFVKYNNKKYICLIDHKSQVSFELDNEKWKEIAHEYMFNDNNSVICTDYGKQILDKLFKVIDSIIEYTNNALITKVQIPFEQVLDLHLGDKVILDCKKECLFGAQIQATSISGAITGLDINICSKEVKVNVEISSMLPVISLEAEYQEKLKKLKQSAYADEDYMQSEYVEGRACNKYYYIVVESSVEQPSLNNKYSVEQHITDDQEVLLNLMLEKQNRKLANRFKIVVYPEKQIS